uniref:MHC class I-like antigen recognition-like domain-containing protein n=1 Tax=Paramormyrops kingsleyae TaxID=1676925 RepID=A0A3B3S2A0_9TELE
MFVLLTPSTHSLQYVYSGSSGIPNLPEFMTVGLVDGEPFTYYDSNIRREVPRQEWMAKAVYAAYWDQQTQISMNTEPVFKNNIEIAKMRFNQTGGIHTVQWMYGCEWDDEIGVTGAVHQYGYDGSDFIALDFRTMTYVAPVMQAIPTKQKWDSNRAELENIKSYFTQECIDWLKKYVSYGKCTLERTVRPEVSLLQKDPSSPVTCHATGFFPKGIVLYSDRGAARDFMAHKTTSYWAPPAGPIQLCSECLGPCHSGALGIVLPSPPLQHPCTQLRVIGDLLCRKIYLKCFLISEYLAPFLQGLHAVLSICDFVVVNLVPLELM